jgi:hypothetical protein
MSRIICTHPGRAGDILWALPTVRAISEHYGVPVDLCLGGEFVGLVPLFSQQAYLGKVWADPRWSLMPPNEWQHPVDIEEGYDCVWALGYRGWPTRPLPFEVYERVASGWTSPAADLLTRPWITVDGPGAPTEIAVGFSEYHFELKFGLLCSVEYQLGPSAPPLLQLAAPGSRWTTEVPPATVGVLPCDWVDAARAIRNADLFFGCCSGLHVLACAMGKPCVIMEPIRDRLDPIFWPYGQNGPQTTLVRGNDGQATWDARACVTALKEALRHVS